MYQNETKEKGVTGLHDARCTSMKYDRDKNTLTFIFEEGFFRLEGGEGVRTGRAEMECLLLDTDPEDILIYSYENHPFLKNQRRCENWPIETFMENLNKGAFEFEFVTTFEAYQRKLYRGYIWQEKRPYHRECEIEFRVEDITYRWDD